MRRLRTSYQSFLYIARAKKFVFELRKVRSRGSEGRSRPLKQWGNSARALKTLTVKRTRSVAHAPAQNVETRKKFDASATHRAQTRKFAYLMRVANPFVLRGLLEALA